MNNKVLELCKTAAEYALERQQADGSMPSGKNGPHNHNMTPARNTCHFSILFAFMYNVTGESRWKHAGEKCLDVLSHLRPLNGSYWHRCQDYRSSYNGLIGQAWSLEALLYGYSVYGETAYLEAARSLVACHKFDRALSLWHEADLDGSLREVGGTLNQQIWFTAMAWKAYLGDQVMANNVNLFLTSLGRHMKTRASGLIYSQVFGIPRRFGPLRDLVTKLRSRSERYLIDSAYQIFTLLGLAFLYKNFSSHAFFKSRIFNKALSFCFTRRLEEAIASSLFGYGYNVPGFELPFIQSVFSKELPEESSLVAKRVYSHQIERHFSGCTGGLLACNAFDNETLAARIYEICRLDERWEF